MKKIVSALMLAAALSLLLAGCKQPDNPSPDEPQIDQKTMSEWATTVNSDLASLRMTITSINAEAYVKSISSDAKGWTLELSDGKTPFFSKADANLEVKAPVVGIKETGGEWYWTVEGAAVGNATVTGSSLKLRWNDSAWEVSTDGGSNWTAVQNASGSGKALVADILQDDYIATVTLQDGTAVKLSKLDKLGIAFASSSLVIAPGQSLDVEYTLTGATTATTVEASANSGSAQVSKSGDGSGLIRVTAPDPVADFKVTVNAKDGERTATAILDFEGGVITIADASYSVGSGATTVDVPLSTNYDYDVAIDDDAAWVSYAGTKAVRSETVSLNIAENTASSARTAIVKFLVADIQVATVAIVQEAARPDYPMFFVKAEGAGTRDGSSWENAMGAEEVRALLDSGDSDAGTLARRGAELDGAQIYFAAGEYVLNPSASPIVVNFESYNEGVDTKYCDITLLGGYSPSLTGIDVYERDIDQYKTTLTAGAGTAGLMEIQDAAHIGFDGFSFIGIKGGRVFYINNGDSGRAMLDLDDCYMEDCGDGSKSGNMENTCVYLKQGIARLNHVIFNKCYGGGRGPVFGANTNKGYIFMNRCCIYSTQGVSTWGASVSSSAFTLVNNSTFAHQSKCNNGSFGGKNFVFCNSTLVQMTPAFEGLLRVAGSGYAYVINSIVENQNTTVNASQASNTYRICETSTMESGGYNVSNSVASVKSGKFLENDTDSYDIPYASLGLSFNSELFVMDPTLSEALPSGRISETTLKERLANCLPSDSAYASEQGICKDFISWIESKGGFAIDQVGNQRNASAMWPGAYERQ